MTAIRLLPLAALALLAPALAAGQNPAPPDAAANRRAMYEDVETMRRLLNQGLRKAHAAVGTQACYRSPHDNIWIDLGSPIVGVEGPNYKPLVATESCMRCHQDTGKVTLWDVATGKQLTSGLPQAEGTYLKGQGVLYAVTLPTPLRDPRTSGSEPAAAKLPSDWELTHKQVRGEKTDGKPPAAERRDPALADVILKLLADNGRHFSQLGDSESLTVIVTFRPPAHSQAVHTRTYFPKLDQQFALGSMAAASDQELLGDLHMKQGKFAEAAKAYLDAVKQSPQQAGLPRKAAQAYLAAGKLDEARQWVEKAQKSEEEAARRPAAATSYEVFRPVPYALPSKLIVGAPKKLLDQVAAGKMTFDEFKKAATVEYLTFPAPEKK